MVLLKKRPNICVLFCTLYNLFLFSFFRSAFMYFAKEERPAVMKAHPEFEFSCVTSREVADIIRGLKLAGAVGHDTTSTYVIKQFDQVLIPHITKVINLALMTLTYPQMWKF